MTYRVITAAAALVLLIPAAISSSQAQMPGRERAVVPNVQRAPNVERAPTVQRAPSVQRREAAPRVQRAPRNVERQQNTQTRERAQVRQRERATRNAEQQRQRTESRKQASPKKEFTPNRTAREKNTPNTNQARNREGQQAQQVNRLAASDEQRVRVRDGIFKEKGLHRISRKEFGGNVRIGGHVNRRHRLYYLTPALLAFAPIYYGYRYLVVDDDICIVDPESYAIVDVIPASGQYAGSEPYGGGGSRPQLALSSEDMHFIYASVPKDRMADVRIRLALGAEVPGRVELQDFPGGVVDRVPQVQAFRYIVVENDVVIVDPNDRAVALVITE
jgi:hypothetical protein